MCYIVNKIIIQQRSKDQYVNKTGTVRSTDNTMQDIILVLTRNDE